MVLGFDEKRPARKDYVQVAASLCARLTQFGKDGLSLMYFGSFVRGDFVFGRSDIDAIVCFPHDVVIDRAYMHRVGVEIAQSLAGTTVPLQLSPIDITTAADGRFCTFSDDFEAYFQKEGKPVLGPDVRGNINYTEKKPLEFMVAHALRKARKNRLMAARYEETDLAGFNQAFYKALDAALSCPKQLIYLKTKHLISSKVKTTQAVRNLFPEVSTEPLEKAQLLFHDTHRIDVLYRKPKEALKAWDEALTFFESMVHAYINHHPLPPDRR